MAENAPSWAVGTETEQAPSWALSTPQEKLELGLLDPVTPEQRRQEFVTGAKRGIVGGLGTLGDVSSFLSRLFGVDPKLAEKFRGFPTSEEVGKKLEPVIGKAEGPSSDVAEFLANPLSYVGPGGLVRKLGGAVLGGTGAEIGKATLGEPGEIVGGLIGGGLSGVGAGRKATTAERAGDEVLRRLRQDQVTPQQISDLAKTRPKVAVPMDIGGTAIASEVERLGQTSPAGRQVMVPFLTERQKGTLGRISSDLTELTGSKRTALQATEQVMAQRAAAAKPAYQTAFQSGDREIWSSELERLTSAPAVQSSMGTAVTNWRDNVIADGYGAMNPTQVERGGLIKWGGSVPVFPNLQFWDYTKGALDKMIDAEIRPDGTMTRRGRNLAQIANNLRQELDRLEPSYAAARHSWSGPSSYLRAIEEGKGIFTRTESAEEMAANFNALSEVDKQAYRESVVSSVLNRMQNNPAKLPDLSRELRSPAMRAKIATILPTPEARAAWQKRLDFEIQSAERVAAGLGGSATARRLAQMEDAREDVAELAFQVVTKSKSALFIDAMRHGYERAKAAFQKELDREKAKILTGEKPLTPSKTPPSRLQSVANPTAASLRSLLVTLGGQNAVGSQ